MTVQNFLKPLPDTDIKYIATNRAGYGHVAKTFSGYDHAEISATNRHPEVFVLHWKSSLFKW